jgi:hypothetical protein
MGDTSPDYRTLLLARASGLLTADDFPASLFRVSLKLRHDFCDARRHLAALTARARAGEHSEPLRQELISTTAQLCVLFELERDVNRHLGQDIGRKLRIGSSHQPMITLSIFRALRATFLASDAVLVSPPYRPLCGKIPLPATTDIPSRTFASVQYEGVNRLVLVSRPVSNGRYEVCTETPESPELVIIVVHRSLLTVFPWCLPHELADECDFAMGDRVMAISASDSFHVHPGVVIRAPTTRGCGYAVHFDDLQKPELVRELWISAAG